MNLFFLIALSLATGKLGMASEKLPEGICPFDESKIEANFAKELRTDLGPDLRRAFLRREKWYGGCNVAESAGPRRFILKYDSAEIPFTTDSKQGKIERFVFYQPAHLHDSWEKLASFLKEHWPASAFYVSDAEVEHSFREDVFLPIGEGRVVLLVAALEKAIAAGKLKNRQTVKLLDADKAQDIDDLAHEKEGFAFPLEDLRRRLFSRFDRTAADVVLRLVGRTSLENGREPASPFLSRREFAWLMTLPPEELAKLSREDAIKAAVKLDRPHVLPPLTAERYDHLEKIEWRATAQELCEALSAIMNTPELKAGLASTNFRQLHPKWKGGVYYAARDFGIAQTAWVAKLPGRKQPTCFSLILNAKDFLDEEAADEIHARFVSLIE